MEWHIDVVVACLMVGRVTRLETARLVAAEGSLCMAEVADVRDSDTHLDRMLARYESRSPALPFGGRLWLSAMGNC